MTTSSKRPAGAALLLALLATPAVEAAVTETRSTAYVYDSRGQAARRWSRSRTAAAGAGSTSACGGTVVCPGVWNHLGSAQVVTNEAGTGDEQAFPNERTG